MKSTPDLRADVKRVAKWAAVAGAALALVCPYLPERYQAPCAVARAVASTCTLGGSP